MDYKKVIENQILILERKQSRTENDPGHEDEACLIASTIATLVTILKTNFKFYEPEQ